ncbi:acyl-CoA dehydrogenase [Geothermobacter hydrogeniphilus]|uniref:Acyl-CoA dehydrogenase n=1 Tax=Geothermobacter hydrogeniphilus TaxID=1969733 RepID=A0A1X0Y6E6_9BACT|nr:acyl-CoA dehydrogenase [Geothermobacter hydrogeniphilus]ORJ60679.1 acyl-CoA dehydrogenase [Geothermobacter hydrogeniphilus]
MLLFNPHDDHRNHADARSRQIVEKTIAFFEKKGLKKIKEDDQAMVWYEDFLEFVKEEEVFADLLTPQAYAGENGRWDMWRISHFNEVLAFYGLCYWYTWQVSILGLGPIWMGENEAVKRRAAKLLRDGGIFAFGLSEQEHGADLYSSEMTLVPQANGTFLARGRKYYIGNGNCAALISTFGKIEGSGEYVFFVVESDHPAYECVRKIDTSGVRQAYVAEYALHDYPIREEDILLRGEAAWNAALNTINIGKYELGCASIGIVTHCLYEAINHAGSRQLYGMTVTDFPHVKQLFVEVYARLHAMKLFAMRAADYLRVASSEDRRYLLFNPIVKMKVTGEGERCVGLLHEVIAARGFEQQTWFEMAIRDIGMLPKLEGTTHVNMALILKFIQKYFFTPVDYPEVPRQDQAGDDGYLFRQQTGKLKEVHFPDWRKAFAAVDLPNVRIFVEQAELLRQLLLDAPPNREQQADSGYMLAAGELFTLIPYAQLILENSAIYQLDDELLDVIFALLVRDFAGYALRMVAEHGNSEVQEVLFRQMLKKPVRDEAGFNKVWRQVLELKDCYRMSD